MSKFIWFLHTVFKTKTWYREMFKDGWCQCEYCDYVDRGSEYICDEDWYCDKTNKIIDGMDECPRGRKMPLDENYKD